MTASRCNPFYSTNRLFDLPNGCFRLVLGMWCLDLFLSIEFLKFRSFSRFSRVLMWIYGIVEVTKDGFEISGAFPNSRTVEICNFFRYFHYGILDWNLVSNTTKKTGMWRKSFTILPHSTTTDIGWCYAQRIDKEKNEHRLKHSLTKMAEVSGCSERWGGGVGASETSGNPKSRFFCSQT